MHESLLSGGTDLPPAAIDALERGRKIEAIKRVREERGVDLKTAKEMVEHYSRTYGAPETDATRKTRNMIREDRTNVMLVIVLLLAAGAAAYFYVL